MKKEESKVNSFKRMVKRSKKNIFMAFISGLVLMAGLYQLEIIYICISNRWWFDLPFYIIKHPDCEIGSECYWKWMAFWRDVFYLWIIVGSFMFGISLSTTIKKLVKSLWKKL